VADEKVLSIPVDTSEVEKLLGQVEKYHEALKKMPGLWKMMSEEQRAQLQNLARITAALSNEHEMFNEVNEDQNKHFGALQKIGSIWTSMAKASTSFLGNVLRAGESILKWGGIIGGAIIGGSIFGIDRLAASTADLRQSAQGIGFSPGQLRAWQLDFARLGQQDQLLDWLTQMEHDPSKTAPWYALMQRTGMRQRLTGNAEADALVLQQALRRFAQTTPQSQLGTYATALGVPLDVQTLERYSGAGPFGIKDQEFLDMFRNYQKDRSAFGMTPATARRWQEVLTTFERASATVKTVLINALGPLAGPLSQLAVALAHVIGAFMGAPAIKKAIEDWGKTLQKWTADLTSPEGQKKINQLISEIGGWLTAFNQHLKDDVPNILHALDVIAHPIKAAESATVDAATYIGDQIKQLPVLGWIFDKEQKFSGAIGGSLLSPFLGLGDFNPNANSDIAKALEKYHGDMQAAALSLTVPGFENIYNAHQKDYANYLPKDVQQRLSKTATSPSTIVIKLQNETKHDASVATAQLAPSIVFVVP
jgi:hypothetical protein